MAINREREQRLAEASSLCFEYCTLGDAAKKIAELIKEYGKDAVIHSYCDSYSNSEKEYLHVMVPRPETDKEYDARIKMLEDNERRREENDRREFERLQAKFKK
jgi:thiamine kinase-like enzyme